MSSRSLPPRPDLEQYKKQAKELVKGRAGGAPEALERIGKHHPRFQRQSANEVQRAVFKLSDAQLTIAREHGFETWSQMGKHIRTLGGAANAGPGSTGSDFLTERIRVDGIDLEAHIHGAEGALGIVLLTGDSGSQRYHPGRRSLANELHRGSICTVVTDLLTEEEELADLENGELSTDIGLLGKRTTALTDWLAQHAEYGALPLGYFASGNSAAGAMLAAGERTGVVRAIVSGGGRPDLGGPWLWRVPAPTLFIVGSKDTVALGFTQSVMAAMPHRVDRKLAVLEDVRSVFDEAGATRRTGALALHWFQQYLVR